MRSLQGPSRTAAPHPALAPYIRAYVGVSSEGDGAVDLAALPAPILFVSWGGAVRIVTSVWHDRALPEVSLFGPGVRMHRAVAKGRSWGFFVRFSPTGARALLGERVEPGVWDDGLPADVRSWAGAVVEAPTFEARTALADAFWRRRLPSEDAWAAAAVGLVVQAGGAVTAGEVARQLGVSDRTLRRRFHDDTGLGLKAFAQVERYRQAHGLLLRSPQATWRDACEQFGYADQAHFVRAFRRYAGEPPTRWRPDEHGFDLGFGLREEGA